MPHGRTDHGGKNDRGAWGDVPAHHAAAWAELDADYQQFLARHPSAEHAMRVNQLGTLGTGNRFIEICLDEAGAVWVMLHSEVNRAHRWPARRRSRTSYAPATRW